MVFARRRTTNTAPGTDYRRRLWSVLDAAAGADYRRRLWSVLDAAAGTDYQRDG